MRCAVPEGAGLVLQVRLCTYEPRRACRLVWNTTLAYTRAPDVAAALEVAGPAAAAAAAGNETLYAEAVLTRRGAFVTGARAPLTFHTPREPVKMLLLDPLRARLHPDDAHVRARLAAVAAARARAHEPVRRWRPALRLVLAVETAVSPALAAAFPVLREHVDPRTRTFTPLFLASTLAAREDECPEVAADTAALPLAVTVSRTGSLGVLWLAQLTQALEQERALGFTARDIDDVKGLFLGTPPAVLALTLAASFASLALNLLATKNDIAFWRTRRSDLRGIALSTVVFNAVARAIVLLYLWDNSASLLVLGPAALGTLVDLWKISRALAVRRASRGRSGAGDSKDSDSDGDKVAAAAAQADRRTARWLLALLAPVVLGYTAYTLVWVPQRSWTSWLLGSLTSLVHTLGFVMMTPQLIVNHRLKTVAYLPWRALAYRAVNTFIDDLFAFVLRMPTMHRISCFRDDIVFFIFLYQRWKYPIDRSRNPDADAGTPAETKKTQ